MIGTGTDMLGDATGVETTGGVFPKDASALTGATVREVSSL